MDFSNTEIIEHFVNPLRNYPQINIRMLSDCDIEVDENSTKPIKFIWLNGDCENFYITFRGSSTSIYISDEDQEARKLDPIHYRCTFSEEFMFIDDRVKDDMHLSNDTYGNVVYEGILFDKTHKEILLILQEMVLMLVGIKEIEIEKNIRENISISYGVSYNKYNYIITIKNGSNEKCEIDFENIKFIYN